MLSASTARLAGLEGADDVFEEVAGIISERYFDAELGIRVSRSRQPLSEAEIQRAMDDEDRRHREQFGGPADRAASRPKP